MYVAFSPSGILNSLPHIKIPSHTSKFRLPKTLFQYVTNYVRTSNSEMEAGNSNTDWMSNAADPPQVLLGKSRCSLFTEKLLWQHLSLALSIPVCFAFALTQAPVRYATACVVSSHSAAKTDNALFRDAEVSSYSTVLVHNSQTSSFPRVLTVWKVT
jgi:hypothetical protein